MGRSPTRAVPLIFNFTRTVIFFFFFEKDPYSNFNVHATLIKIQVYSFSKKKKIKFIARFSVCPHGTFPFTNPCQLKYYVIFYDSKKKKKCHTYDSKLYMSLNMGIRPILSKAQKLLI